MEGQRPLSPEYQELSWPVTVLDGLKKLLLYRGPAILMAFESEG